MGWAGPAQPTGPDSAQKMLGRFWPKMDWADLSPKTNIPFWARPGLEGRAGPGSAWPRNQNGRGELFSPHPCMQNAIRSACREEKNKYKNEREEELPGAGVAVACCVSGGAVAEAGGGVLAHGRRLQAALLRPSSSSSLCFSSALFSSVSVLFFCFSQCCYRLGGQ